MGESFDAYYEWLGIAPKDQPPNYYRLLGVDLFEPKGVAIEHAADRQMAHLRTFQTGRHSALSQRLLNEVAAARLCLLKPEKRAAYDAELRKQLAVQGDGSLDSGLMEALRQAKPREAAASKSPANLRLLVGIGSAALIGVLLVIVWLAMPRSKPEVAMRPEPKTVAEPVTAAKEPPAPAKPNEPASAKPSEPASAPAKPAIEEKPPKPAQETPSSKPAVVSPQPPTPNPQPLPTNPSPPTPTPAPQSPTPNPQSLFKLPVPEGDQLDQATKAAGALFSAEIEKAKTPADKVALAKRLLAQSLDQAADAAGRYALLRMAGELAVGARDAETAFQCVDQIDAAFEVDRFGMKTAILTGWAKDARSADARKWLVEHLFAVGDEALDAGNVDAARELGKLVTSKSAGLRDKEIVQRLKTFRQRFTEVGKDAEELQQAQAFLVKDPRHAQSNLVVGRYLCFTKADWRKGLPLLLLASDASLQRLAEQELKSPPTQPNDQLALADGWWEIAMGCRRSQMNTIKTHAGQWYRQALAALPPGLVRSNVEKRLAELKKLRSQSPAPPLALAPFDAKQAAAHQQRWAAHPARRVRYGLDAGGNHVGIGGGEEEP
jgi:outer membrane biosynthesis protein TonB